MHTPGSGCLSGPGGLRHEADDDKVRKIPAHEILSDAGAGRQILAREGGGITPQRPRRVGVVQLRRYRVARQVCRSEVEESEPVLMNRVSLNFFSMGAERREKENVGRFDLCDFFYTVKLVEKVLDV